MDGNGFIDTLDLYFFLRARFIGSRQLLQCGAAAWTFIKKNWKEINERYPDNAIPRMLSGIVRLDTAELAADTSEFLGSHPVPQGTKTVAQHLEKQRVNVALRQRDAAQLTERFV